MMLSIFVPAYNEAGNLEENIHRIQASLDGLDFELFIVDDASDDDTGIIGQALAGNDPRIKYLRYDVGPTRRENLARSFSLAQGEHIVYIDADLSAGPEYIPSLISLLESNDIAIASRYAKGSNAQRGFWRLLYSRIAVKFTKAYFSTPLTDYQCGLKAFRKGPLEELVEAAGFDDDRIRGFAWDTEILVRASKKGYRIAELPVKWIESEKSSVRIMRDWRLIPYVLKLKKRL
jgi:glycosyltransferase AglD